MRRGLIALSPLLVFLLVYLISSIVAKDFYTVPVSAAFLVAIVYAIATSSGDLEEKITTINRGIKDDNVLIMVWVFILAGAFAATAKSIGAIDSAVNFILWILPDSLIFAALFISACFISLAIGTSVGTIAALIPIATGVAEQSGISGGFLAAIVVGGAFFGDNLSFISDTTIAATRTQGVSMRDKFFTNIRIVLPAALIVTIFYIICGIKVDSSVHHGGISVMKLLPYILVIVLSLKGVNVIAVLMLGILANVIIGFTGGLSPIAMLQSIGEGIAGMGDLIVVTLLAAGMLSLISSNGGLDFIVKMITKRINGRRGAEASIAGLVTLANVCTANNTIAIITVGSIAKEISAKFGVDPRRSASILDTFSCLAQSLLPYGAQVLMAAGLASVSSLDIIIFLYYPIVMGICVVISILFKKSTM